MRAFLGQLDRVTIIAAIAGAALGALWFVNLPLGLALSGLAAPLGAFAFVMQRRWLEAGAFVAAIGFVPTVAYRIVGPPALPDPLPENVIPAEVLAPGGGYVLMVLGLAVVVVAGILELPHGRRREANEADHARRRSERLGS